MADRDHTPESGPRLATPKQAWYTKEWVTNLTSRVLTPKRVGEHRLYFQRGAEVPDLPDEIKARFSPPADDSLLTYHYLAVGIRSYPDFIEPTTGRVAELRFGRTEMVDPRSKSRFSTWQQVMYRVVHAAESGYSLQRYETPQDRDPCTVMHKLGLQILQSGGISEADVATDDASAGAVEFDEAESLIAFCITRSQSYRPSA